ncbi:unnamed protein product [Microthlaspi erraticum]|uniref:Uncharacterized protein n=1 Tax=Microthlaspi erraticum TaxID=1685480 RepID=A0A6D2ISN1_9BRAS|nr:unnamed protein product [Microthlaspi erraticum]
MEISSRETPRGKIRVQEEGAEAPRSTTTMIPTPRRRGPPHGARDEPKNPSVKTEQNGETAIMKKEKQREILSRRWRGAPAAGEEGRSRLETL